MISLAYTFTDFVASTGIQYACGDKTDWRDANLFDYFSLLRLYLPRNAASNVSKGGCKIMLQRACRPPIEFNPTPWRILMISYFESMEKRKTIKAFQVSGDVFFSFTCIILEVDEKVGLCVNESNICMKTVTLETYCIFKWSE